jgi:hypothetical protein
MLLIVMAGLVPAIHVFHSPAGFKDVDARAQTSFTQSAQV